ncbi:MAG: spore coat protein CotS [Symbiobacteriaceae bacterium]|jgi:hypothetical protein|nr:spore coat protein CotS [Symbiobacteriaceae bacterium]
MLESGSARKSRAERPKTDNMKPVVWLPPGAPVLVSSNVDARRLQSSGKPKQAEGRQPGQPETKPPAGATSAGSEKRRTDERPSKSSSRRSEKASRESSSGRAAKSGKSSESSSSSRSGQKTGSSRGRAGGPIRFAERLPVAHASGSWQIPDSWDLPEAEVTRLGPDGEVPIPADVDTAAQAVMKLYDMRVSAINLVTSKPDKGGAIWRIETNHGPRSLKLLHREAQRSLFSIGAQEYLVKQGARVPPLVRTRSGEICVQTGRKLWIVTDWIEPLIPATKVDLEGAAALCHGLGEFQKLSRGYVPPQGARYTTRLARWPNAYRKILSKIGWFREIAQAYREFPVSQTLLSVVDTFEQQARDAIARLEASAYESLVARGEQAWGIVHQDR